MHTVGLTWQHAWAVGVVLAVVGGALATARNQRVRWVAAFLREAAVIGFLYGLWQLAGRVSLSGTSGAYHRAASIERFEQDVHLPSEAAVQRLILGHPLIVQGANLYYDTMHLTMMFVFLIWLFVRHRDQYRRVRTTLAVMTLGCLIVQLVPVAPPRMLPGIVDTAMKYGQSVYANGLPIDQLSAMPSLHVGWAVLVGYYVWQVSPSRWRFVGPLHAVLTMFVVVATGNHWWLDGFVAISILCASAWIVIGIRATWRAWMAERRSSAVPLGDGALVPDLQPGEV